MDFSDNQTTRTIMEYYKHLFTPLYKYAFRILGEEDVAKDLVQEVFVKLWNDKDRRTISNVKAYLFRATHNLSIDHIRKKTSYEKVDIVSVQSMLSTRESAFDILFSDQIQNKLKKEIEKLPPKCLQIFKMNRQEGFSYQEIAKILGISHSTVKNQMAIAMHRLYEVMKNDI